MGTTTNLDVPADAAEISARLRTVREELGQIARASFTCLNEADTTHVAQEIEVTNRACEALTTTAVAGLEAGGSWAQSGARTFARWWTATTHRKVSTSRSQIKAARTLRDDLPHTSRSFAAGEIGGEHVQVLTRRATKTSVLRQQLQDPQMGEAFLLEQATRLPVEAFARVVAAWAIRTDPEAADRAWREQDAAEELFLSPTLDGYAINGWLDTEHGQVLDTALNAIVGVPTASDDRHPCQRRADALTHLARTALDSGGLQPNARVRPHIAVTIEEPTLEALITAGRPVRAAGRGRMAAASHGRDDPNPVSDRTLPAAQQPGLGDLDTVPGSQAPVSIPGDLDLSVLDGATPASWADGTPIPAGQTTRLLCAGEFHRVVFGSEGEILDSGRTCRLFTPAQARAVVARDGHCQFPDCSAPPTQGEIHHSIWWYHQGRTSTDNAILLCWHHHDYVHQHRLSITRTSNGWRFSEADGRDILATTPPSDPAARPANAGSASTLHAPTRPARCDTDTELKTCNVRESTSPPGSRSRTHSTRPPDPPD